ncbi:MAG TPA: membrane transport protein [Candidatus Pelethomonas intestinigallinarum]|nr:membrane transport protein [Candidatus Pelethomonas intestinigallinarum]
MTVPMIIALLVTAFMVWLIMTDKVPFGAAPLIACALMVLFGVTDIATAFRGFSNSSIVMLASFMVIIAALQKTRFIAAFKRAILRMASKGGYKAYVLIILVVMLGTSLFGTGSTAYYVMVLGLLSTIPSTQALPRSKFLMPAGFACNHPLIPVNTALQYGYVIAVLEAGGAAMSVSLPKFAIVNLCLSLGFLIWCLVAYKFMPVKDVPATTEAAAEAAEEAEALPAWQEYVIYGCFIAAIIGMVAQSYIGDQGYAVVATAVCVLLLTKIMNFKEICSNLGAPIILMSAGVIGVAEALGVTGLTNLVGETVAGMLGSNINPFVLVFVFCVLTSVLATLTGSTIGTVLVFAPMAVATCVSLGWDPTAAASAIVVSGWCGHFLPIDGLPAMCMGLGNYTMKEFWKFTIPQYFIRLLALTAGALLLFPV